ncbi:hypothetical protein [Streptomyces hiroshimensis]|uniref:hypothetical protein n=1 Tax=Streptomyces hiroshimensis TaxID=66424 RepID=UPI0016779867|nr:hypothetical protein [Streptomyces hiroshimensis]
MTDATRRTIRTTVQTTITLAALLPVIIDASGILSTLPWAAGALAVAAGLTRIMAIPGVQSLMPAWLRTHPRATLPTDDREGSA